MPCCHSPVPFRGQYPGDVMGALCCSYSSARLSAQAWRGWALTHIRNTPREDLGSEVTVCLRSTVRSALIKETVRCTGGGGLHIVHWNRRSWEWFRVKTAGDNEGRRRPWRPCIVTDHTHKRSQHRPRPYPQSWLLHHRPHSLPVNMSNDISNRLLIV